MLNNETIVAVANAITANATAIKSLLDALPHDAKAQVAHVTAAPAPVQAPIAQVAQVAAPVSVVQAPVVQAVVAAPAMPAPPTFATPTPAPAQVLQGAPFTDGKGLLDYVMSAYKAMGAAKGAGIQGVLTSLGLANINDVKPEQYAALYAGVEALKA